MRVVYRAIRSCLTLVSAGLLIHPCPAFCGWNGTSRQGTAAQARQPMGSLSPSGPVTLNGTAAPVGATVFAGDSLETGGSGAVAIGLSARGALKLGPSSQMVFSDSPQYIAELRAGSMAINSFQGATDVVVRAGNYLVGPVIQGEASTATIVRAADGSFQITCQEGSIGVLPLDGSSGRFLQTGQSVNISTQGELVSATPQPAQPAPSPTPASGTTPAAKPKSKNTWIFAGIAAVGAVGAAAGLAGGSHGTSIGPGGGTPVSPSAP